MKKINTERIDEIAEKLNDFSLQESEALLDEFANEQPDYFKYIMRDDFELLGDDEHELLLFTSMTLWFIIKSEKGGNLKLKNPFDDTTFNCTSEFKIIEKNVISIQTKPNQTIEFEMKE